MRNALGNESGKGEDVGSSGSLRKGKKGKEAPPRRRGKGQFVVTVQPAGRAALRLS